MKTTRLRTYFSGWRSNRTKRTTTIITVLGLAGFLIYLWLGDAASSHLVVHSALSADEAAAEARSFVTQHGYSVGASSFMADQYTDEAGYHYMEHTFGPAATRDLIESGQLPVVYWRASGSGADPYDYYQVSLSLTGQVISFYHSGPEANWQTSLSEAQSRQAAETYLTQLGWDMTQWTATPAISTTLAPTITQYAFTWNRPAADWRQQLRITANVIGQQITSYAYYLDVPDTFAGIDTFYARQFASAANGLSDVVFLFAAALIYYLALRHGGLPWHYDVRVFLGAALLSLIVNLSEAPLLGGYFGIASTDAIDQINYWLWLLKPVLMDALGVFLLWKGGTLLCRQVWPRQNKILERQGNPWRAFHRSYWRGLMLAGLALAYVAVFSLVARQVFNAGIPTSITVKHALQDYLPYLASPVYEWSSSLWAGVSEELMFRFVGVTLMLYLFRNKFIALVVPAALWSFAHLFYIRDPFYLRGIELLIAGVLLEGYFFLKFDLTTVIVGHFAYNVAVGQLLRLKGDNAFQFGVTLLMIVGLITPFVVGWIAARRFARKQPRPSGPAPHLTLAGASDAAALAAFPMLPIDGRWVDMLGQPACVVAALKAGDELIGVGYGLLDQAGLGQLRYVYIQPDWRRRGWGTALADKVYRHLQNRGAQHLTVYPMKDNSVTQAFLFKLGYRAQGQAYTSAPPHLFRWRRLFKRRGGVQKTG